MPSTLYSHLPDLRYQFHLHNLLFSRIPASTGASRHRRRSGRPSSHTALWMMWTACWRSSARCDTGPSLRHPTHSRLRLALCHRPQLSRIPLAPQLDVPESPSASTARSSTFQCVCLAALPQPRRAVARLTSLLPTPTLEKRPSGGRPWQRRSAAHPSLPGRTPAGRAPGRTGAHRPRSNANERPALYRASSHLRTLFFFSRPLFRQRLRQASLHQVRP